MNLFNLTGQTAIVSGGSGWLGRSIVEALAAYGAHVVAVSRDVESARMAFIGVEGSIEVRGADIGTDEWPQLIDDVIARRGRLDILVNNAHVGRGGSLRTATRTDATEAFELAAIAPVAGINAARAGLDAAARAGASPSIINVASMYGLVAPRPHLYAAEHMRNPPFYGAAKAALIQLTRYAAAELGPSGIRVNAVAPGPFPAESVTRDAAFVSELAEQTMLRRVGRPVELQSTMVYLASSASSFVTGTVIEVDGGWTAW